MRLLLSVIFLFASAAPAGELHQGLCDFPVPDYKISTLAGTGISQVEFNRALDLVQATYGPVFKQWGCPLKIKRSWSDPTPNAQAWRSWSGYCYIEMFGGLARHPDMTYEGFIEVALHEIGHHIGGDPLYPGEFMSCEGQADYWAVAVGARAVGMSSAAIKRGGISLANTLAELNGERRTSYPGPKLPAVSETECGHPAAQCRRVTYELGRLKKPRPACWYRP